MYITYKTLRTYIKRLASGRMGGLRRKNKIHTHTQKLDKIWRTAISDGISGSKH